MEQIRSRKNQYILHLRALAKDNDARRDAGEYVCDGEKLLREALQFGAEVTSVLWRDAAALCSTRPMQSWPHMPRRSCTRRARSLPCASR